MKSIVIMKYFCLQYYKFFNLKFIFGRSLFFISYIYSLYIIIYIIIYLYIFLTNTDVLISQKYLYHKIKTNVYAYQQQFFHIFVKPRKFLNDVKNNSKNIEGLYQKHFVSSYIVLKMIYPLIVLRKNERIIPFFFPLNAFCKNHISLQRIITLNKCSNIAICSMR